MRNMSVDSVNCAISRRQSSRSALRTPPILPSESKTRPRLLPHPPRIMACAQELSSSTSDLTDQVSPQPALPVHPSQFPRPAPATCPGPFSPTTLYRSSACNSPRVLLQRAQPHSGDGWMDGVNSGAIVAAVTCSQYDAHFVSSPPIIVVQIVPFDSSTPGLRGEFEWLFWVS